MEQQSSVKRQRRRVQATGDEDSGSLPALHAQVDQGAVELGADLVHALIDDINEELGQLVSDFFNVALPADAIARVLSHLSVRDLGRCACVSRQWHGIAEEDEPWRQVVARELDLAAERGHDEASAVTPPALPPHNNVKTWYRDRAELAIAADANWRERNCVLHTAAWGTKGSRLQRGIGPTSLDREAVDQGPRALCFAFSATDNGGDPTCTSNQGDTSGPLGLWICVVGMSDGKIARLVPSRSGTADGEQPLVAQWAAEVLPPIPPVPHDRMELCHMWPQLTCLAAAGDWVASGDETGQIRLWRAADGAPGPALPFRHGQPLNQSSQALRSSDDQAIETNDGAMIDGSSDVGPPIRTPDEASAAMNELMEKQATLALLEREGWEVHDLPAAIETLQHKLAAFEALAADSQDLNHDPDRSLNDHARENRQHLNEQDANEDTALAVDPDPSPDRHRPADAQANHTSKRSTEIPQKPEGCEAAGQIQQHASPVLDISRIQHTVSEEDTRAADSYATMAEQYIADRDMENAAHAAAEGLRHCPGHPECTRISQSLGASAALHNDTDADLHEIEAEIEARFRAELEQIRGGDSPGMPVLTIVPCTVETQRRATTVLSNVVAATAAADLDADTQSAASDSEKDDDVAVGVEGAVPADGPVGTSQWQTMKSVLWASVGQDECEIRLWGIPNLDEQDGDGYPAAAADSMVAMEEVQVLVGHSTPVHLLSTCGNGRLASAGALGASNGDVRIWDLHSCTCEMVVGSGRAAHESFTCLAASGPRVVVALATGDVRASAVPSGLALPAPLDLGTSEVSRALCVSLSSSLVAVGNAHGAVTVFDTDSSACGADAQQFSFRAHPEPVKQVAWLDPVNRGVNGRGCLLITMGSKAVRLWQIRRAGKEGQLQQGWLWELGRGGCASMAIAVRRGRLLWLSQPTAGDRQVLQVYDFCDRTLANADTLASVSLAEDGARDHAAAAAACDIEVWTGQGGAAQANQFSASSEYGWLDAKEADQHTTQLSHLSTKQKPQLGGFFGSLNSLLCSVSKN